MEIINKKENRIVFKGKMESGIANSIRRYINRIPTLAIDEVEVTKNDSPLYDEAVAHRLGLVPLKMVNLTSKNLPKIKIKVSGEGKVYSEELKGSKVAYDKIPITTLSNEKELEITATTNLGMGEEHSKYSPGILSYRKVAEITMDKKFADKVKELCPNNPISEKRDKIIVKDDKEKEVLDLCEGIANIESKKAEINFNDELVLNLESFGQMDVKQVLKKAIEELKKDLSKTAKKIGK
jgi:DNA-directed RNA polymerase subunit D|tara:strand:- start:764 stop:1477 length:714 start_codon:yes stop_codon:yes gene_type:complete